MRTKLNRKWGHVVTERMVEWRLWFNDFASQFRLFQRALRNNLFVGYRNGGAYWSPQVVPGECRECCVTRERMRTKKEEMLQASNCLKVDIILPPGKCTGWLRHLQESGKVHCVSSVTVFRWSVLLPRAQFHPHRAPLTIPTTMWTNLSIPSRLCHKGRQSSNALGVVACNPLFRL